MHVSYLGFDHTATLFHIRDSPVDPVDRPIFLTNAFSFSMRIHNVSLPEEAKTMFQVGAATPRANPEPMTRGCAKALKLPFFSPFCAAFRCGTSAPPSSSLPTNRATFFHSSSSQSGPPSTLTATSCSSQTLQSFTCLSGPTQASWRYKEKHKPVKEICFIWMIEYVFFQYLTSTLVCYLF